MQIVHLIPEDDNLHPQDVNSIVYIGIYDTVTDLYSHTSINLIDVDNVAIPLLPSNECYLVTDKKLFDKFYPDLESYDINTQFWLLYNRELIDISTLEIYNVFKKFYKGYKEWCRYIPFLKCKELFENIISIVKESPEIYEITQSSRFYCEKVYKGVGMIENAGIAVSLKEFNNVFNKNYTTNIVRCNYRLHTTTGRPSNTFDNVNYSALNKKDGSRRVFISRFDDEGILVELDLDAYHLRLISQIIGYNLPNGSVHEYFGRLYFNTSTLTEDQYNQSKAISFRLLYGELPYDYYNIKFFKQVEELKSKLWNQYITENYIESPISGKIFNTNMFTDINKSKLFNYMLQTIETEYSILYINDILQVLNGKLSKLILYTYDSFLLDFNINDGLNVIKDIARILGNCKIRAGSTYHDLKLYNIRI
jgi:hypothetical protein